MNIFEVTLKEAATLGGFPVKVLNIQDQGVEEGWKSTLAGAALAGATALGGAGHAQAADLSSYNTQYLQQVVKGEHPRPMVSVDDAKAELQLRANGKQQTVTSDPASSKSTGFSKEYLQKAADPNRTGRYMISVEKAQELLKQLTDKQGVDEAGNANSGRRGSTHYSPPDSSPVKLGRIEKTATGTRHHADPSRYGGYEAEPEDDHLLGPQQRWKLDRAVRGVGEEASPMIKPPSNRFDNKQEAFAHAREHGGKVFKSTYINPNTGNKQISFVVKKEPGVAEGQLNELFEPTLNYYKLSNGKTVQASYRPTPNQSPVPFTAVKVSYVNPALKPQGGSFDSTGVVEPWTNAPDGVKQAIQKFVTQPQQGVAETSISSQVSLPKWQMGLPVFVKHLGQKGEIASLGNDFAIVNVDMRQYRVPLSGLKRYPNKSVAEAIKLNAPQRTIPRDELQGYADRIKTGTKTKRDKFSPIIHGSNIRAITKDDNNTEWDLDDLARQITTRPKAILGTNAKMEKSKTEGEIIYDLTLPALSGIVVDEDTGDFVEITTCPGAGQCQLFCYARKGGYVMFPASSMSAAQALNFLVNDPEGYSARVNQEIKTVKARADKAGIQLVVRWHDAGDFFSKEYLDLAYDVAKANPDVQFYAYTKMGDVATGATPANFTMNFSSGSKRGEEKKVEFHKSQGNVVKQGVTVPKDMFFDLIARKGNSLIKDAKGRTQFASPEALDTFKQRLAQQYKVDPKSIITYDQMLATPVGTSPKWNVIVQPGAGDRAANRKDVIDSYLMFH